jgi:hypothetical protein
MQKYVIHQNIERKMQCISYTLGMKERKETKNYPKKVINMSLIILGDKVKKSGSYFRINYF